MKHVVDLNIQSRSCQIRLFERSGDMPLGEVVSGESMKSAPHRPPGVLGGDRVVPIQTERLLAGLNEFDKLVGQVLNVV